MIELENVVDAKDGHYISSPLSTSDGEYFDYVFKKEKELITLYIHNVENDEQWQFFISIGDPNQSLAVSEYITEKPLFCYEARTYVPVIELLIDIIGDSCCIIFMEKQNVSYDIYHVSFVKQDNDPMLPRGNFNKQLIRLNLEQ